MHSIIYHSRYFSWFNTGCCYLISSEQSCLTELLKGITLSNTERKEKQNTLQFKPLFSCSRMRKKRSLTHASLSQSLSCTFHSFLLFLLLLLLLLSALTRTMFSLSSHAQLKEKGRRMKEMEGITILSLFVIITIRVFGLSKRKKDWLSKGKEKEALF